MRNTTLTFFVQDTLCPFSNSIHHWLDTPLPGHFSLDYTPLYILPGWPYADHADSCLTTSREPAVAGGVLRRSQVTWPFSTIATESTVWVTQAWSSANKNVNSTRTHCETQTKIWQATTSDPCNFAGSGSEIFIVETNPDPTYYRGDTPAPARYIFTYSMRDSDTYKIQRHILGKCTATYSRVQIHLQGIQLHLPGTAAQLHLRGTTTPARYSYTCEVQLHLRGTATPARYNYTVLVIRIKTWDDMKIRTRHQHQWCIGTI